MAPSSVRKAVHDEFSELVSLSWMALGQTSERSLPADAQTVSFFSPAKIPASQPKTLASQQHAEKPLAAETAEPPPPSQKRRLEKLLPHPSLCAASDTSAARKKILTKAEGMSDTPLYDDPSQIIGPRQWTIFTHITPTTVHEEFVRSIAKAIEERLHVHIVERACTNPLFALELPMAVDDSEVVMLVVDSHLESSLQELLDSIHSYTSSSELLDHPFSVMGSINGKLLRTLVLHPSTHEDRTIKAQLWQSLKALATLKSP